MRRLSLALPLVVLVTASWARADEGMWTYNNFPSDKVAAKYGFKPTQAWLDKVRLSSARLAQGCSASFVSPDGLVMTNHHCAHGCIAQVSTSEHDYVKQGFVAATLHDEVKCPALEVNQLQSITDVTARMNAATQGKSGAAYADAQKAAIATITKECATSDDIRCDVVTLYKGGAYNLYTYKRFQDVRLAFAPEIGSAFFGGDPDNFNFPRYDLDASFLRVYENGKPAATTNFFPWSKSGVKPGDLTFVSGHPGHTSRENTVAELEFERDFSQPRRLMRLAEYRGQLTQFGMRGVEEKRISEEELFGVENGYKARTGRQLALLDKDFFAGKVKAQADFVGAVKDPSKKAAVEQALRDIDTALTALRPMWLSYMQLEVGQAFMSDLFPIARMLVRAVDELAIPNEKRLREYTDAQLPGLKQELFSPAPIFPQFEEMRLTFALTKMRELLGADDPIVKKILGKKSPETFARELSKSILVDVAARQKLFDGGKKALDASTDPMIVLARSIDADARALRKKYENDVESVMSKASETLAKARFEIYGTGSYPDATFTLRLSYGAVEGWKERGVDVKPITTFGGAFERHTGEDPFRLPDSWLKARSALTMTTPLNFCTTNDIIGGNSGSPVINKSGEIVGLIFDGNLPSLGGDYGFSAADNRAVAVHSAGLLEAMAKIYGATRIVDELKGKRPAH